MQQQANIRSTISFFHGCLRHSGKKPGFVSPGESGSFASSKTYQMPNLFNTAAADQFIDRLNKIEPGQTPLWGKMNAAQMCSHCLAPFAVYYGELKMKQSLVGILFGRMAKKKLFANKPWPQGLPTAKEFVRGDDRELDAEREKLVKQVRRFAEDPNTPAIPKHPFFGKMSTDEWAMLASKHLDHHLRQFGV
jgi:hypothetical protein